MVDWAAALSSGTTRTRGIGTYAPARPTRRDEDRDAVLVGNGPPECTSCTALSVLPLAIFDVNGYYRELGVNPRATRAELRRAYHAKVGEQQSGADAARLTYILSQLLQPDVRFAYDCTPLGELFEDRYVLEAIKRQMLLRMDQKKAQLRKDGVDVDAIDDESLERDIYAEMGVETDDETPGETVDDLPAIGEDGSSPAKFEYSYYLWGTGLVEDPENLGRLAEWQHLLVSAFAREGVSIKFAVGFHGKPHGWVQGQIGSRNIFLLNVLHEPTEAVAAEVAKQYSK